MQVSAVSSSSAYHRPRMLIQASIREGGPFQQWLTRQGCHEMIEAAKYLPPSKPSKPDTSYEVHFLTGANYWYQTLFCAWSLQENAPVRITPIVHDDGTLQDDHIKHLRRVIPWIRIVGHSEIERELDCHLPRARFPELRARQLTYPHLRKLTDIHCGRRGWTLVLDSDMLFFREPGFLLDWLAAPQRTCHMRDAAPAYGYSARLMEELAGHPIPPFVNVGFCGLRSDDIEWDDVERWCKELVAREGMSYFLEQAITAMLVAGKPRAEASPTDYRVLPDLNEGSAPSAGAAPLCRRIQTIIFPARLAARSEASKSYQS